MSLAPTVRNVLSLQFQTAEGNWVTVAVCDAGSIRRTRRLALPPRRPVTATHWRLVKRAAAELTGSRLSITRLSAWRETEALSPHKRWSFDFDTADSRYGLIATAGNVEIYRRNERVASVPSPFTGDQVTQVRRAQALDTLLAFHNDVPPHRIGRQGAHTEWDSRPVVFENMPVYDYTGERAGGVNDVQQLTFRDYQEADTFNLALEGEVTNSIVYAANMATLAASVQAALEVLPNVGDGGVVVTSTADKVLRVEFVGDNRADDIGELAPSTLTSAEGGVSVATLTQGKASGEPVMSETRGWPSCGVFFEQRLFMAGLRSRPQSVIASRTGFFYDLNTRGGQADKGIDVDLSTDESTDVLAMFPGRHLQLFSRSAEFFCPATPITPPPPFPRTSRVGMEPGTPLLELEGGTLFVTAGARSITFMTYDDAIQGYSTRALSSFASHLTVDIVAGGFRRHRSTSEPNLALWVRADGDAALMSAMLEEEVLGFCRWTTDGALTEAGGELAGELYVCARRTAGGVESHRLEVLDDNHMLDASVRVEGEASEITGLGHLEGRTVALYIDGADAGDAVVSAGRVGLPYPSRFAAEAGLLFVPRGRLLPLVMETDPRGGASWHARVGEIAFRLGPTAGLYAGMTGKRQWPVPLKRRPAALLDEGPGQNAFEGWTRLYPVPGFQADAQIDFSQPRPGPLEIREIVVTVQT